MRKTASAPGKIILTGEFAVVFGEPGVALPFPLRMEAIFEDNPHAASLELRWENVQGADLWLNYLRDIVGHCEETSGRTFRGMLTIKNGLPLGKGMGSSTALVIVTARVLLGEDCEEQALAIEDIVNPNHSGIDFETIWHEQPIVFRKGKTPEPLSLPENILEGAFLIDTGRPNESTKELVAWMREHQNEPMIAASLKEIGACTHALLQQEDLLTIVRRHHRAQVALGVVPEHVQTLIADVEAAGGAAKVLGAGARTGGGGMVLCLSIKPKSLNLPAQCSIMEL